MLHIVRFANQALTKCRPRTQNQTLGHRGRKGDPLHGQRKVLLSGAGRLHHRDSPWVSRRLQGLEQVWDP
ncbi:MAG: transposase, partial [Acidimicrobiia bacterium]|nr:transposase [Acidimicrobiia bacterium]MYG72491.1 transposase [Acidimicrobiia bacterium]